MDVKTIPLNQREESRTDGALLKGYIDMYRATGDKQYRDGVLKYLDNNVAFDGKLMMVNPRDGLMNVVSYGKALFFALDETGEERYKNAVQRIMEQISSWEQSLNPNSVAGQDVKLPHQSFVIEYDTRFGNKQRYKAAAYCFQTVRNHFFDEEKQLYDAVLKDSEIKKYNLVKHCRVLIHLVDTIEEMDMQLYEHYRALADLFLEAVRGLLSYRIQEIGLLTESIIDSDDPITMDGNLMTTYALFKGIRLGLLDDEKYLPIALQMVSAMENICASHLLDSDFPGNLCYRMMTEAEMIEVKKK